MSDQQFTPKTDREAVEALAAHRPHEAYTQFAVHVYKILRGIRDFDIDPAYHASILVADGTFGHNGADFFAQDQSTDPNPQETPAGECQGCESCGSGPSLVSATQDDRNPEPGSEQPQQRSEQVAAPRMMIGAGGAWLTSYTGPALINLTTLKCQLAMGLSEMMVSSELHNLDPMMGRGISDIDSNEIANKSVDVSEKLVRKLVDSIRRIGQ